MKKLVVLFSILFLFILSVEAQRGPGRVKTVDASGYTSQDTLDGNNNRTLAEFELTGTYNTLQISCAITRVSTAAGGTLYLKTGIDSASVLVVNQSTNPTYGFSPNDTLATSDVATQYWNITIPDPEPKTYHIFGDGDVNDTVKVVTKYIYK